MQIVKEKASNLLNNQNTNQNTDSNTSTNTNLKKITNDNNNNIYAQHSQHYTQQINSNNHNLSYSSQKNISKNQDQNKNLSRTSGINADPLEQTNNSNNKASTTVNNFQSFVNQTNHNFYERRKFLDNSSTKLSRPSSARAKGNKIIINSNFLQRSKENCQNSTTAEENNGILANDYIKTKFDDIIANYQVLYSNYEKLLENQINTNNPNQNTSNLLNYQQNNRTYNKEFLVNENIIRDVLHKNNITNNSKITNNSNLSNDNKVNSKKDNRSISSLNKLDSKDISEHRAENSKSRTEVIRENKSFGNNQNNFASTNPINKSKNKSKDSINLVKQNSYKNNIHATGKNNSNILTANTGNMVNNNYNTEY